MRTRNGLVVSLIGLAVFIILALGSTEEATSKANGQASNVRCNHDPRLVDGQADYGISVIVTVKNIGEPGVIHITPKLSTSEGEWSRDQNLHFDAGESRTLTYFFHEPTINAESIQCRVKVFP